MNFTSFKKYIKNNICNKEFIFGCQSDVFFAEYKPQYPASTLTDFTIEYCWTKKYWKLYQNGNSKTFKTLMNLKSYYERSK